MTTNLIWKALKEPLRDLGRTVVLAIIPVMVDSLNKGQLDLRTVLVVGVIAGLRFVEKFLYEKGKIERSLNPVSELLQFK
ncbi:MAG: hypothetical protein M1426_00135 [Patescibacteria group bacterium]|nr:hypothetical protein [Patescibacteria group bacterium]